MANNFLFCFVHYLWILYKIQHEWHSRPNAICLEFMIGFHWIYRRFSAGVIRLSGGDINIANLRSLMNIMYFINYRLFWHVSCSVFYINFVTFMNFYRICSSHFHAILQMQKLLLFYNQKDENEKGIKREDRLLSPN